jgi:tetraacyldisaccharide 4'-kinase
VNFAARLAAAWYRPGLTPLTALLAPLAALFAPIAAARAALFRAGVLSAQRLPVPVVVIGNITAGGSGKTPLTIALARSLAAAGFTPGVVSRGYGRSAASATPMLVEPDSSPEATGDEPLLIARAGFPVAVAADRVAAATALVAARPRCDVILADDGLQHYRLARDVEIAVVDARRGFGNGWRLPAGPLREPPSRLARCDAVVALVRADAAGEPTGRAAGARDTAGAPGLELPPSLAGAFPMMLTGSTFLPVRPTAAAAGGAGRAQGPEGNASGAAAPSRFRGPGVHAVAGIGDPARFFATLAALGIDAEPHAFPDHHAFRPADLDFAGATAILMTAKDAVKCERFAGPAMWYLPIEATIDPALTALVVAKLRRRRP